VMDAWDAQAIIGRATREEIVAAALWSGKRNDDEVAQILRNAELRRVG